VSWRRRVFDALPALSVRGAHLRDSLRTVTVAWMFGVVWMSCISGSQMTVFARLLGFSDEHFGYYQAIGYAAFAAQLVSAVMIERTGLRKHQFLFFATIHRLGWLAIAAVPLLLKPGPAAVGTFLGLYAVTAVLSHMHMPAWTNWMGDLIPRRIRGRYLANRRMWTIPIQVVTVLTVGLILDQVTVADAPLTPQAQPVLVWAICIIFAVGAIAGTIDILLFVRIREIVSPPLLNPRRSERRGVFPALGQAISEVVRIFVDALRDRAFLHVGLYSACIGFAMSVGGQFFFRNCLENLGYSKFGTNVVFMVCGPLTAMLTYRLWGKLTDRWGRRPVLILTTIGVVFSPLGWFLIPAEMSSAGAVFRLLGEPEWIPRYFGSAHWLAYLVGASTCTLGSIMWGGIELARLNIVLGFSQTAGRSRYVAAAAVFTAVGGCLGGLAGGGLAEAFASLRYDASPLRVGPFLWNNWHLTFAASMLARIGAIGCLIGMPDPGARGFRDLIRQFRVSAYSNVLPRLFWPLRTTWLRRRQRRNRNGQAHPPRKP